MQIIVSKKENNLILDEKFNLNKALKFYSGSKTSKIGLEYERLSLDKNTLENAPYEKIAKIIEHFAKIQSWDLIYDDETIIGAKDNNGNSISLEPGCQLEISLKPQENIFDIDIALTKITNLLDNIAKAYDVLFLGYGISPVSSVDKINLLEKQRYKIMYNYLPYASVGELCPKMMKQTAGLQINLDYKNSIDAYNKLKFFNLIMPFLTGLCSNSPFEKNNLSDKKSIRAHVWRYTGAQRCNLFYRDVFSKIFFKKQNLIKNYIEELFNVPMVYIEKNGKNISLKGKLTFGEYIKNGFKKHNATLNDFLLHQSLCFPDVRLKNYIEIRNHDSQNPSFALALCAFYKGLTQEDFNKLLKQFSYLKLADIEKYNEKIIKQGLNYKVKNNKTGWDIIQELYKISLNNLSVKEKTYLEPIKKMLIEGKTTADLIQEYNISSAKDLVEFLH